MKPPRWKYPILFLLLFLFIDIVYSCIAIYSSHSSEAQPLRTNRHLLYSNIYILWTILFAGVGFVIGVLFRNIMTKNSTMTRTRRLLSMGREPSHSQKVVPAEIANVSNLSSTISHMMVDQVGFVSPHSIVRAEHGQYYLGLDHHVFSSHSEYASIRIKFTLRGYIAYIQDSTYRWYERKFEYEDMTPFLTQHAKIVGFEDDCIPLAQMSLRELQYLLEEAVELENYLKAAQIRDIMIKNKAK